MNQSIIGSRIQHQRVTLSTRRIQHNDKERDQRLRLTESGIEPQQEFQHYIAQRVFTKEQVTYITNLQIGEAFGRQNRAHHGERISLTVDPGIGNRIIRAQIKEGPLDENLLVNPIPNLLT